MAQTNRNILLHKLSGQIGKQIVIKRYRNKTVITAYPDMRKVTPSKAQQEKRNLFAEAVVYARTINNDPVKKSLYQKKTKKGQTVYHFAVREYLRRSC